ncbi:hypothetical protein FVEN_g12897 [Fusarium venenatum]|nr:hypothetical protein FVEN_g12897 [Fusarium venenatum]
MPRQHHHDRTDTRQVITSLNPRRQQPSASVLWACPDPAPDPFRSDMHLPS